MVTLYIVRHGETIENTHDILQGQMQGHLSDKGKRQARLVGQKLRDTKFDVCLVSDLARATDTANIINQQLAKPVAIEPCRLLRERDWGELTGKAANGARELASLPATVETIEQICLRARRFLGLVLRHYDKKTVLAVSHGFYLRCLQAVMAGKSFREIPIMNNADCRILNVTAVGDTPLSDADRNSTAVSAN